MDAPPSPAPAARRTPAGALLALSAAALLGAAVSLWDGWSTPPPDEALRRTLRDLQAGLLLSRSAVEQERLLDRLASLSDPGEPRWRLVIRARPRDLALDRPVAAGEVRPDAPPFSYGADVDVGRTEPATGAGRRLLVFRVRLAEGRLLSRLGIDVPGTEEAPPPGLPAVPPAPEAGRGP